MATIIVPNFQSFQEIIAFNSVLQGTDGITLDFSHTGFAKPSGMVLLSHFIRKANSENRIDGIVGFEPYSYAANMGFFDFCNFQVPHYAAHGSDTYTPLQELDLHAIRERSTELRISIGEHVNNKAARLAYLITRQTRGDLFNLIKYSLREIIRNAAEHSNGSKLTLATQYWPQRNQVQIAMIDDGIGIRSSLTQNPKYSKISNDLDAIRIAILPSSSGKKIYLQADDIEDRDKEDRWGNSGYGLYVTSQLARECGAFTLGSHDAFQSLTGSSKHNGPLGINGVFISIDFHVEQLVNTDRRIAQIVKRGESFARRHVNDGVNAVASAASKFIIE